MLTIPSCRESIAAVRLRRGGRGCGHNRLNKFGTPAFRPEYPCPALPALRQAVEQSQKKDYERTILSAPVRQNRALIPRNTLVGLYGLSQG
ncbi:hypothetical protein BRAS3843_920019 [Bradyrhizobium sp. STM 3843]|nr:hypothetical protein BRAS3843_920019 [Bradyrhizobium sp. STM 3843]